MDNAAHWSLNLGRWGGIRLRLHVSFLLFAAVALYVSCFVGGAGRPGSVYWLAPAGLLILLGSAILHVLGHFWTARHLGVTLTDAVIVPWGEFATNDLADNDPDEALVHLAGPVANLAACLMCVPVLLWQRVDLIGFFHPLAPQIEPAGLTWLAAVKLTFWINAMLLLVNLLPVFPFDSGEALRVALTHRLGKQHAARFVNRLSQIAAGVFLVAAVLLREPIGVSLVPAWFALTTLAIVVFFGAPAEQPVQAAVPASDDNVFGYDFSEGYTSLERSSRMMEESDEGARDDAGEISPDPAQARGQRDTILEAEEELQVDAILARVHQLGLDCLSAAERQLLERVSARYRNRFGGRT